MGSGGDRDADRERVVGSLYGFNWASALEVGDGFANVVSSLSDGFEARMSPQVGGRTTDLAGLRRFIDALQQDFSCFRYEAREIVPADSGEVLVRGIIEAVARASKMPLSAPFEHRWSFEGGEPVRVEAHIPRRDPG